VQLCNIRAPECDEQNRVLLKHWDATNLHIRTYKAPARDNPLFGLQTFSRSQIRLFKEYEENREDVLQGFSNRVISPRTTKLKQHNICLSDNAPKISDYGIPSYILVVTTSGYAILQHLSQTRTLNW
jgi:hypothetical protein